MIYKPLPDSLTIKESPIHGLGLFAKENIEYSYRRNSDEPDQIISTTYFGPSHIAVTHQSENTVEPEVIEFIRTPLGGFINHSSTPNLRLVEYDYHPLNYKMYYLLLKRDIKAGEELTLDYTKESCGLAGYTEEEWLKI